ncbi:MAG: peptidyl-prolyl cis-trans isomerase [Betaproteobacteria bacterium]|nr:peptidyl-prolyl cis-trans isomerase [Betaproteobacteria bacterium]
MIKLGKGQLSAEPVRTQFGWHLIRVDNVRAAQLPPLEALRPQIEQNLMEQRLMAFQEDLRGRARIR